MISKNPLDYVTKQELQELGLSYEDIDNAYQPSAGGVFHCRGVESTGKTLWIAHRYRWLIDKGFFTPDEAVGNMTFKGKYAYGYTCLKGDDLREYLWDLTHKPYKHKIVIIDEADTEFPARFFSDTEQTEIGLRLWHTAKLHNHIFLSSHKGNSVDIIMHLATHYYIFPDKPDFESNTLNFTVGNKLDYELSHWTAYDVIKTMLIYNRREMTENTSEDMNKKRPSKRKKKREKIPDDLDIDIELELEKGLAF